MDGKTWYRQKAAKLIDATDIKGLERSMVRLSKPPPDPTTRESLWEFFYNKVYENRKQFINVLRSF